MAEGGKQTPQIAILLKSDNQRSIALAHNHVFYLRTKHINIQHHYICDEVALKKIKLSYVLINQMIADGFRKALIHVKFHGFIE